MVRMVQIALPADLHTQVKIKATERGMTLKAYIIETLAASVQKGGAKDKK